MSEWRGDLLYRLIGSVLFSGKASEKGNFSKPNGQSG
jgi:hypothetical protein